MLHQNTFFYDFTQYHPNDCISTYFNFHIFSISAEELSLIPYKNEHHDASEVDVRYIFSHTGEMTASFSTNTPMSEYM